MVSEQCLSPGLEKYEKIGKIQNNMGLALMQKGYMQAAMTSFSNSLTSQVFYKDKSLDMALTLNNLASCYFQTKQFDKGCYSLICDNESVF